MTDKFLRGKEPLTFWRGANGAAGGYLYRGGLLDPANIDPTDAERLVGEGFLDWVVRDGEGFKLAEDSTTGDKGDPVTVGDNGFPPADEVDLGTVNSEQQGAVDTTSDEAKADAEVTAKRAAAKEKLPADGSMPDGRAAKDVWVEFLAGRGYSYDELVKQDTAELKALAKQS